MAVVDQGDFPFRMTCAADETKGCLLVSQQTPRLNIQHNCVIFALIKIENQMRPYTDGPDGAERVTRFSVQMLYKGLGRK